MEPVVYLNGIDGDSGGYLSERGIPIGDFARLAETQAANGGHLQDLQAGGFEDEGEEYALLPDYGDGSQLDLVGWAIIFPARADPKSLDAILEALDPLIQLRQQQTGGRMQVYRGADGVQSAGGRFESKADWLARHGAGM